MHVPLRGMLTVNTHINWFIYLYCCYLLAGISMSECPTFLSVCLLVCSLYVWFIAACVPTVHTLIWNWRIPLSLIFEVAGCHVADLIWLLDCQEAGYGWDWFGQGWFQTGYCWAVSLHVFYCRHAAVSPSSLLICWVFAWFVVRSYSLLIDVCMCLCMWVRVVINSLWLLHGVTDFLSGFRKASNIGQRGERCWRAKSICYWVSMSPVLSKLEC